jgi:capsid protein
MNLISRLKSLFKASSPPAPDKLPTHHRLVSGPKASLPFNRKQVVQQVRFELARNPDVAGMLNTLAAMTISSGPRTDDDDFNAYADQIGLSELLFQSRVAKARDGEIFWLLVESDGQVLPLLIEAEQVTDFGQMVQQNHDGIIVDELGRPVEYHILANHPESMLPVWERISYPASQVLHYRAVSRTSQIRGISELYPALPYIAMLSRLTEAAVRTAEIHASLSGALKSDVVPGSEQLVAEPFERIEVPQGGLLALPAGWELQTFPQAQRNLELSEIRSALLKSIGRSLGLPAHLALGDSSAYNFSSARLDHLTFRELIRRERKLIERTILNPLYMVFSFGRVLEGERVQLPTWQWPPSQIIDAETEVGAIGQAIEIGLTTVEEERAKWQGF